MLPRHIIIYFFGPSCWLQSSPFSIVVFIARLLERVRYCRIFPRFQVCEIFADELLAKRSDINLQRLAWERQVGGKEYQHGGHKVMQHLLSCFAAKVISYQFCNCYLNTFSDLSCAQGIKCHTIARILQLSGVEQRKTKFRNGSIYKSFLRFRGSFVFRR